LHINHGAEPPSCSPPPSASYLAGNHHCSSHAKCKRVTILAHRLCNTIWACETCRNYHAATKKVYEQPPNLQHQQRHHRVHAVPAGNPRCNSWNSIFESSSIVECVAHQNNNLQATMCGHRKAPSHPQFHASAPWSHCNSLWASSTPPPFIVHATCDSPISHHRSSCQPWKPHLGNPNSDERVCGTW